MTKRCCVPKCRSNKETKATKKLHVTAFSFPKNEAIKKQWIQAIGKKKFVPTKYQYVCIKHFRKTDILWNLQASGREVDLPRKIPKLKDPNIVPCIFSNGRTGNDDNELKNDKVDNDLHTIDTQPTSIELENDLIDDQIELKPESTVCELRAIICRLCLEQITDDSIEIFSKIDDSMTNIADIISQHFWFKPEENDSLSKFICMSCFNSVNNFHEFYNKVKVSQNHFKDVDIRTLSVVNEIESKIQENPIDDTEEDLYEVDTFANDSNDSIELPSNNIPTNVIECMIPMPSETEVNEVKKRAPRNPLLPQIAKKPIKAILDDDGEILKFFDLRCDQCFDDTTGEPLRFTNACENRLHYKIAHKMFNRCNGYCRLCELHQTSSSKMRQHIRWHQNPNEFACKFCKKHFQYLYLLRQHELAKHADIDTIKTIKYLICDICGLKALTLRGIKTHMRQRHIIIEEPNETSAEQKTRLKLLEKFECEICGKIFPRRQNLKMHIQKIHNKEYSVICDLCGHGVHNKTNLRTHQLNKHGYVTINGDFHQNEKVQCNICGTWATSKGLLTRHMKTVHFEGKLQCPHCPMQIKSRYGLKHHIQLRHENRKNFKCMECGEAYNKNYILQEHIASVHTGATLYQCDFCPEGFSRHWKHRAHFKKMHPIEWQQKKEKEALIRVIMPQENN